MDTNMSESFLEFGKKVIDNLKAVKPCPTEVDLLAYAMNCQLEAFRQNDKPLYDKYDSFIKILSERGMGAKGRQTTEPPIVNVKEIKCDPNDPIWWEHVNSGLKELGFDVKRDIEKEKREREMINFEQMNTGYSDEERKSNSEKLKATQREITRFNIAQPEENNENIG